MTIRRLLHMWCKSSSVKAVNLVKKNCCSDSDNEFFLRNCFFYWCTLYTEFLARDVIYTSRVMLATARPSCTTVRIHDQAHDTTHVMWLTQTSRHTYTARFVCVNVIAVLTPWVTASSAPRTLYSLQVLFYSADRIRRGVDRLGHRL